MWRGILPIVYIMLNVWSAQAQSQMDRSKYELIRKTINFLATDKTVSRDTGFRISCETMDYTCFEQQLASDPITGIQRWYKDWKSVAVTDEAGLTALRDQVFAAIFDRPGKGYRKQLAGYGAYSSQIEQLIRPSTADVAVEIATDTMSIAQFDPTGSDIIHPEPISNQNDNSENQESMIAYLALVIGIIALIIVALPFFRKKEQEPFDFQNIQNQLDELTLRIKRLDRKIADNQVGDEAVTSLTEIMESIEKRVVELEDRSRNN